MARTYIICIAFAILNSTQGVNYRDLLGELDINECTYKQYAVMVASDSNPETADCGTKINIEPWAFLEGTRDFYLPRTAVLTENCLLVCTPEKRKSFHAETGILTNYGLIRRLNSQTHRTVWLMTYLEPCNFSFQRHNGQRVLSCTDKIISFCQNFRGIVNVVYREKYRRNDRSRRSGQEISQACGSYRRSRSLQSRLDLKVAVLCKPASQAASQTATRTRRSVALSHSNSSISCRRVSGGKVEQIAGEVSKDNPQFVGTTIIFLDTSEGYIWQNDSARYVPMNRTYQNMVLERTGSTRHPRTSNSHVANFRLLKEQTLNTYEYEGVQTTLDPVNSALQEHAMSFAGHMRTLPNVGYVFGSYNINNGNPFNRDGIDPGICLSQIFKPTYKGTHTADQLTFLPDGVYARKGVSYQNHATSHIFRSAEQYSAFFRAQVGIQASFGSLFSASMNAEHHEKLDFLASRGNIMISTVRTCYVYSIGIDMFSPPDIDPAFIAAIRKVSINSRDDLDMFVAQYGTHFFQSLKMGYRKGLDSIMTESQFTNAQSVLSSFEMLVSAPFIGGSMSAEKASSFEKAIFNKTTKTYEYSIGKEPTSDGVASYYAPLTYKLVPLMHIPGLQEHDREKLRRIFMLQSNQTPK